MRIRRFGEPWILYLWSMAVSALEAISNATDEGADVAFATIEAERPVTSITNQGSKIT